MKFKEVKGYVKESFVISTIKFILVPLIVVSIGFLFKLDVDLASSSWIFNTTLWILLLPIMYGIVHYI
ncbi:hypothetical protein CJ195_05210 [Bacillus sp. UMB0899]|nr:hypothetical protein CJ195_05210 [Bacillus sp. UMB0899]